MDPIIQIWCHRFLFHQQDFSNSKPHPNVYCRVFRLFSIQLTLMTVYTFLEFFSKHISYGQFFGSELTSNIILYGKYYAKNSSFWGKVFYCIAKTHRLFVEIDTIILIVKKFNIYVRDSWSEVSYDVYIIDICYRISIIN